MRSKRSATYPPEKGNTMKYNAVIFDFDGTVCNTGEGIIKSVKYALEAFGYPLPENDDELSVFIGPPLVTSFMKHCECDRKEAEALVVKYRERYSVTGVYESELYPEITELLQALKKDGAKIAVASSKPQHFIDVLLKKFEIAEYFDAVCGVAFNSDCETKASIISRAMTELSAVKESTLMVGDTRFDIEGANAISVAGVGVMWGFGTKEEFEAAKAAFIADKPFDIESIALGYFEQTINEKTIFDGRVIHVHEDDVRLVDGETAKREIVAHNGGVAVTGLTDNDEVVLVRQFRAPYKETIFEIPAGKLEKGEDPFEAGKREFKEECGAEAERYFDLGKFYPTPGYSGETIHLYGAVGLTFGEQSLDDDEFLDVYKMPLEEAFEKCINGEFRDGKTLAGIMKIREMRRNGSLS